MATPIQLIVGLGNPGDKYANTRHNAGIWFVEQVAKAATCALRPEAKFHGRLGQLLASTQDCQLLVPTTYMNKSGQSVLAVSNYYKLPSKAILVVHDEIDLPVGVARLKFDGGAGGHNGLKDIIEHLQTKQFYRLRIGVGHPGHREEVADYVLNAPSKTERSEIETALERAYGILPFLLQGEFQQAMQQLHSE